MHSMRQLMRQLTVVSCSRLSEDEVVRSEDLSERTGSHGVHCARLQIHEDRARHISTSSRFVEVHIDALQLQVGVTVVGS